MVLIRPRKDFEAMKTPSPPDYSDILNWAAHPDKRDVTDLVPDYPGLKNNQSDAGADLFYIHRTTLISRFKWNADVGNKKLNRLTDKQAIRNQAGIFNESCRIFAPRYRQATLFSFFDKNGNGEKALNLAYHDVREAFLFYMKNYNHERPLVIAAHSQGAEHATRLIREFFDGKILNKKLIVAYLTGMPLQKDAFDEIPFGESSIQTGCFVTWSTFGWGIHPNYFAEAYKAAVCTNPLTWENNGALAGFEKHEGAVSPGFRKIHKNIIAAKCERGVLWIRNRKPVPFFPLPLKNYVIMDFDLFYINVRENVKQRIDAWFTKNNSSPELTK
jgi:hypothetical protein